MEFGILLRLLKLVGLMNPTLLLSWVGQLHDYWNKQQQKQTTFDFGKPSDMYELIFFKHGMRKTPEFCILILVYLILTFILDH